MQPTTDIPICGYGTYEGMCHEAREVLVGKTSRRCSKHNQAVYSICTGCAIEAVGECAGVMESGHPCRVPLCVNCAHLGDADHGPVGPFAAQQSEPTGLPAAAAQVRASMIDTMAESLRAATIRGLVHFPQETDEYIRRVAGVLIDELSAEVLIRTLSGMAVGQAKS